MVGKRVGKTKIILGPEWKRLNKSANAIVSGVPKILTRVSSNIAGEWKRLLMKNAESFKFTGMLMNSIRIRKGGEGKAGRGVVKDKFFITVTAPHALELVAGPFSQRWVHRDMTSFGGRTFGDWMDLRGLPPFRGLIVGFPGVTMLGRYDELWWDKTAEEMKGFVNKEFPQITDRVIRMIK